MSKLKFGILGVLLGQTLTILYKDKDIKEKLKKKDGFEKIKVIFNEIIDLNKRIFGDVKSYDYEKKISDTKKFIEKESVKLEGKVDELSKKAKKLNKERIQPLISEFEDKANELYKYSSDTISELEDKYHFQEKITLIKGKIEDIKSKIK